MTTLRIPSYASSTPAFAAGQTGAAFWRSLDELADNAEFRRWLEGEFPSVEFDTLSGLSRRRFLQVAAASFALAGAGGCLSQPAEYIVPAVSGETSFTPTKSEYFATTISTGADILGVLVKNQMGRPIKIEGNPDHPASRGATDVHAQAEILALYDPARSQVAYHASDISTWRRFTVALENRVNALAAHQGAGLCLLTPPLDSPTLVAQLSRVLQRHPKARWFVHDPLTNANVDEGMKLAFGESVVPVYQLSNADVIVALDADLFGPQPGHVRCTREFARRRAPLESGDAGAVNRLYVAEACPTVTGAKADHRLPIRSSQIQILAARLAEQLGVDAGHDLGASDDDLPPAARKWIDAVIGDLREHRGKSLFVAGRAQPPFVHALVWAINAKLDALEHTVDFVKPPEKPSAESTQALVEAIDAGKVDTLLMVDVNPVYDAPVELDFASRLAKIPFSAHLGLYRDETGQRCTWHLPLAHVLESWGDACSHDGTFSLVQPLIRPLYGGKSALDLLAVIAGDDADALSLVRQHWISVSKAVDFESWWRQALQKGVIGDHRLEKTQLGLKFPKGATSPAASSNSMHGQRDALEIRFAPDHALLDGRYALNAWMQEVPDPISKLCWGNAAMISPATAKRVGVKSGQIVKLRRGQRIAQAPVHILPGHADDSITIPLGYGRRMPESIADGVGFDANALRSSDSPWFAADLMLTLTSDREELVTTQHHHAMEGRDLVRVVDPYSSPIPSNGDTVDQGKHVSVPLSLYPNREMTGQQWGMVIDLARCVGCNACTIACQAENNIPVVGAEQVQRGREMHWIRIDRYFSGAPESPTIHHQPVPCMHCEDAPCEVVCPVAATTHSTDGLNEMTYNRCVGTRYCSNNCPYKVRRFNFLQYTDTRTESLKLLRNPDVTVRSRGVMEKCTYCVQRIRMREIDARKENRAIRDGEVVTACQQVCPAQAIVFGDINDPESEVSVQRRLSREYGLLTHLNTRPRTTYLADVRNINPAVGQGG